MTSFLAIAVQVHDELVLEVDQSVVKEAALLLKMGMENAASLLGTCLLSLQVFFNIFL